MFDKTLYWVDRTLIPFKVDEVNDVEFIFDEVIVDGYDIFIIAPIGKLNVDYIYTSACPFELTKGLPGRILKLFAVPAIAL